MPSQQRGGGDCSNVISRHRTPRLRKEVPRKIKKGRPIRPSLCVVLQMLLRRLGVTSGRRSASASAGTALAALAHLGPFVELFLGQRNFLELRGGRVADLLHFGAALDRKSTRLNSSHLG